MKRIFMASVVAIGAMASTTAFASIASDADALVPAAKRIADPYTRGLALGWLEIAARQDREVFISHTYNNAAPRALQNARHFIDGSAPLVSLYKAKRWPSPDRKKWTDALASIEHVDERAASSSCRDESAGRLSALTDEAWKEQEETHGTRWVHGFAQIERAAKLAQEVGQRLAQCQTAAPAKPVSLSADALFAFNSAELTPEGRREIAELAGRVKALPLYRLTVTGYTDRIGSDAYNLALSQRRAEVVAGALTTAGVMAGRVEAHGLGKGAPVVDCPGPVSVELIACLAPNRRVTVSVDAVSQEMLDQLNAVYRGMEPGIPVY